MPDHPSAEPLLAWFAASARELPWRDVGVTPWGVLVSEVMLQQTPVARVQPVFEDWMHRWPTPVDLAEDAPGEAIRRWGRLGYPRRALRLHAAARACVDRHGGDVPASVADLRALPGVGEYTAAAVAAFAFGQRVAVLDTNVRRVHARLLAGAAFEPAGSTTAAERRQAEQVLPDDTRRAVTWSVAVMELGALVCTARSPGCDRCPVAPWCSWLAAGRPAWEGPPRRGQSYAGTDRQCRGRLLDVLRDAEGPVGKAALDAAWADAGQRERALDSLVADGLVEPLDPSTSVGQQAAEPRFRLPVAAPAAHG